MTPAELAGAGPPAARPPRGVVERACDLVDRVNEGVGLLFGSTIVVVTLIVLYEVVARTFFGAPTSWGNETTIYLSAMAYLLVGGYALLHHRHVRIDVLYQLLAPRTRVRLDAFTFLFFLAYMLTLIWVGGGVAWDSFQIGETTSTPWNPPIWPVKCAIPVAGLLLLLQGIANLIRDLGWAPGGVER